MRRTTSHALIFLPVVRSRRTMRAIVAILTAAQVLVADAAVAATVTSHAATFAQAVASHLARGRVRVNRTVPDFEPPRFVVRLPADPTDPEITEARSFAEPLVPVTEGTTREENAILGRALDAYRAHGDIERAVELQQFVRDFPNSPWRPSLLFNVGSALAGRGYYSRAMSHWDEAWQATRHLETAGARTVALQAVGSWLEWAAKFGRVADMHARLAELQGRALSGPASAKIREAREGVAFLENHHHEALFSGPEALKGLARESGRPLNAVERVLEAYHPTPDGTSLSTLASLAADAGIEMRPVFTDRVTELPTPFVVHLRSQHFSAAVRVESGGYVLHDPILGGVVWMSKAALEDEASGYALIADTVDTPERLRDVPLAEASTVVGHCAPGGPTNNDDESSDGPEAGGGGPGSPPPPPPPPPSPPPNPDLCPTGMPAYHFQPVSAALVLEDTPVGCSAPRGPSSAFRVFYNHRDGRGPQVPTYSNLGPRWTHSWLSNVTEGYLIVAPYHIINVRLGGPGLESYTGYDGPYHRLSRAKFVKLSNDPPVYERTLPDGTVQRFATPDRPASVEGRIVHLSEIIDPQGQRMVFTYDASFRLVAATDALGRVTTLSYELSSDPLKITKVTDPYGRSALFTYDGAGHLASFTDVAGMTSSFVYGQDDFITAMTTPYGTTGFRDEGNSTSSLNFRFIEATDPTGGRERLEFRYSTTALAATLPNSEVPIGFEGFNTSMDHYTSFYWDKRAMALYPQDDTKATIFSWLLEVDAPYGHGWSRNILHSVKRPLESRIWFDYPNRTSARWAGQGRKATAVARVLDDGSTQKWLRTYDDVGHLLSETDPLGRTTTYTYAANGLDLLLVQQIVGGTPQTISEAGGYNSQHRPAWIRDAAGQQSTYTYNAHGQIMTVTNAKAETTTYVYDAAGDGFLETVTGPVAGATVALARDAYDRVGTVTDVDGYQLAFSYDALDRATRVTYPDGTFDETVYDKLSIGLTRDRIGRVTRFFHDGEGQRATSRDPLGRVVRLDWCACGSLNALIDAKGQRTSWARDLQGRVTAETRADGTTTTSYTYDLAGRLKTVTDPKGQITTYSYAADDELSNAVFSNASIPTSPIAFTYDAAFPRKASMSDGVGTTTYAYKAVRALGALNVASIDGPGMSRGLLKFSGGSGDGYAT